MDWTMLNYVDHTILVLAIVDHIVDVTTILMQLYNAFIMNKRR